MLAFPHRFLRCGAWLAVLLNVALDLRAQTAPSLVGLTEDGQVWEIDSALGGGQPLARAASGWEYTCLATTANGKTWVARHHVIRVGPGPVIELDPEFLRLGPDGENEPRWSLGEGELPTGMAFDRHGLCLGLWPTQPPTLVLYDFVREFVTPLGPLPLSDATDIAWNEGRWYVWSNTAGLAELDPLALSLRPIGPAPEPGSYDFRFFCELPGGRLVAGRDALYDVDSFGGGVHFRAQANWPSLIGMDRLGPHCWYPYGAACAGSGNFTPELHLLGCGAGGGSLMPIVSNGPGGAPIAIFLGLGELDLRLGNGCGYYLFDQVPVVLTGFLSGENPGEGEISFAIPLAHGMRGFANAQGFILDPLATDGFISTNAISLRVPF